MKFQKTLVSLFTLMTVLMISNAALANYRTSSGSGGNYSYELWQNSNNEYYLKIWRRDASSQEPPHRVTRNFKSSREALDHFDCVYAGRSLAVCPQ